MANLTIISVPLPFGSGTNTRQRNAIRSWTLLKPKPEIILFEDEKGVSEIAEEFGLRHVPNTEKNEVGDISMRSIFRLGDELATHDLIMYVDTDVILMSDFMPVVDYVVARYDDFVLCAGRWSVGGARDVPVIDFDDPEWEKQVRDEIHRQHDHGSDFSVHKRGFFKDMPDFSIGQGHWDGWRMGHVLQRGAELVNVADVCKVVHQDHGPSRWNERPHRQRNLELAGKHLAWASDATVKLKPADLEVFLTIVTRCCQRPVMLTENIESVKAQTCHDLEQIFIPDRTRQGIQKADRALGESVERVNGKYVYILDDDCMLIDSRFVEKVKEVVEEHDPDVIMVRSRRPPGPPSGRALVPTVWEEPLRHGACNCLCYVIRAGLWREYIKWFGEKPWGGDWWFLERVLKEGPKMYWLDEIVADARQLGRGKIFEEVDEGWFEAVMEECGVENLSDDDWRLRLWR
jgi:hypothetical protein